MKKLHVFIGLAIILLACQSEPDNQRLFDQLVVSTNYDPQANFGFYSTYALPTDTIGFISNNYRDTILTAGTSSLPRPVLEALAANLSARGYTRVKRNENPDLGIAVFVVNDFNLFQEVIYPGGAYGYPGNYYSGYYGYNSWYAYPYINTYVSNTGILIIEIVDLKAKNPDNKARVIWNAYLGDVYSTIDLIKQSVDAINQAFAQSPYIIKTGQ